jgi:3-hydroxymyristoyl/3-hydroxydecanoyl-(acyl carrier protein) dehydratase
VAGLGPFKFPGAARPGAWLEARARVAGRLGSMFKIEGDVTADGQVVATGSVTLAGGDLQEPRRQLPTSNSQLPTRVDR